jgi:hypothetical protein
MPLGHAQFGSQTKKLSIERLENTESAARVELGSQDDLVINGRGKGYWNTKAAR